MTLLRLTPLALSRSRFALSPLAETLGAIRALSGYGGDPWLAAWHRRHRAAFSQALERDPFAAGLIGLLNATTWLPGFVAVPPPHGMRTTIAQELAQLRRATDEQVAGELKEAVVNGGVRQSLDGWLTGQDWGPRIAELLGTVWSRHVQPDWSRRRALLERDVTYRAGLLAAYGWPHALARMNRRSAWVGADAIRISDRPSPDRVVGDDGMLFVPVSQPRGTWLCESPPDRYALVYPARGAAAEPEPPHPARALRQLLGAGRAAILQELARPATSSELAEQLRLSLGTVGGHLAVLREANLVSRTRTGRRVVYLRTATGDLLASGVTAGASDAG
ncbi:ArsR/SmtB family transcription factor [Kitasatospora kifunensis]|uniref:DNA-binding transcriptional ArsR family regulator n=1 Tax=Kitasatospora kifunensis TaxID=58351 RepID=A0A7W7QWE6_KITKI|nr:winged helix-turn-helix domain-containing protein [Kitasatospora kifunensis]MBB4921040.1 DNA-binding transcriptional ArsR family regulator [Kitasatospora kifunensis]